MRTKGAKPHPGPLVESASMSSVLPPAPTYKPHLPKMIIDDGLLSLAQLEPIVYAGQAHSEMLPAAENEPARRKGYFIGDGTGVGKGREVAGIILDNWSQGRTKAVWVSETQTLIQDAKRDWTGLGQNGNLIFNAGKVKGGEKILAAKGIGFITYDTLKGGMSDQAAIARGKFIRKQKVSVNGQSGVIAKIENKGRNNPAEITINLDNRTRITVPANEVTAVENTAVKSRVDQLVEWLGKDFDGVIAFDEAHNMGNAAPSKTERGLKEGAQKALAGIELQNRLPNARVVYVSATGATEVANLAYADRLGLWGRGTSFESRAKFVAEVEKGGIAAMELVARDMKQLGLYTARNLSFDGVEYGRIEHKLDANQREIYDTLAEAWQAVLRNINEALKETGGKEDARAKAAAYSAFWGAHQRFFNQIVTSIQMPSVIADIKEQLKAGHVAVLQLTNTNEASQERAAAKATTAEEIEDLDITPRDQIIQLVEKSFPTQEYQQYVDENGKKRSRPVADRAGNPVQNKQALRMREALIERLASVRVPQGPLDMVLDHFGVDVVAEVTGRGRRFVLKPDEKTGDRRRVEDSRPGSANVAETDAFQGGKKKILIFSQAGGTGRSYHADNTAPSKDSRRVHYLVQGGWRADKAVQGFGRTHRTNQASAPIVKLVTTDLQGQKRFISSIARRLAQLGALTKGQRQAGDQGIFSARDNLESTEANHALRQFFNDLLRDNVPGIRIDEFEEQTGLQLRIKDEEGRVTEAKQDLPPITQFLNRLLSLKIDMQNKVFDAFSERLDRIIEARRQAGLLDVGLETIKADKIVKDEEKVVHTIPGTDAETRYVKLTLSNRFVPLDFDEVADSKTRPVQFFARSPRGKVYAVAEAASLTDEKGVIVDYYRLINPVSGSHHIERKNVDTGKDWKKIDRGQAETMWKAEIEKAPEFLTDPLHLVTGAILPIWDRLQGNPRVVRLQTDAGERLIGRVVPRSAVAETLKKLGAEAEAPKVTSEGLFKTLMDGGRAQLTNGWTLKRSRVANENRIELVGPTTFSEVTQVKQDGVFTERIDYKLRYFVPTGEVEGPEVLSKLLKYRQVVEVTEAHQRPDTPTAGEESLFALRRQQPRARGIPESASQPIATFRNDSPLKRHPGYKAAKAGGLASAARLVEDLVTDANLADAKSRFGDDVVYLPVIAEEQTGHNAIPMLLAELYAARAGGTTTGEVVQANRAYHTGAGPMERLMVRAQFDGPIEAGKRYVLVDDVTVLGSTLADLADHVQRHGGEVAGIVTLVNAGRSGVLSPSRASARDIEGRHGDAVKDLFDIEPAGLTADEAAYLRNFRNADALRARVAAAEGERSERLRAKGVPPEKIGPSTETDDDGAPPGAVSDSGARLKAADEAHPEFFVRTPFTAKFMEHAAAIYPLLRSELDRIGLRSAGLMLADRIELWRDGKLTTADAVHAEGMITIALDTANKFNLLHHEALHGLRRFDLFTDSEWAILARASNAKWRKLFKIDKYYRDWPEWIKVEEGVAHAYAAWADGTLTVEGRIAGLFKRIRDFFEAVGNVFRGEGLKTAESIFSDAFEGKIGRRNTQNVRNGQVAYAVRSGDGDLFQSEIVQTPDGPREQFVIPGAEREGDKQRGDRDVQKPLKPGKEQKGTDGLPLFDDQQPSMFSEGSRSFAGGLVEAPPFAEPHIMRMLRDGKSDAEINDALAAWRKERSRRRAPVRGWHPTLAVRRDATESEAFKRWFGDSKVVDDTGRPLVVYHGTDAFFDTFDAEFGGSVWPTSEAKEGFWFSASEARARQAAQDAMDAAGTNVPNIISAYLKIENPEIVPSIRDLSNEQVARIAQRAKRNGKDGIVFKQGEDGATDYLVFAPTQIKSTDNRGTFTPDDPRMMFAMRREPGTAIERQRVMQGFLARGQFIDRALRVPFDIFGGTTNDGQWKPGVALFDKASSIITGAKFSPDGRFAFLNSLMETARTGLIDRYGLDPKYVTRDRERALDERAVMLQGAEILKSLKDHQVGPAEAKVLQAILTGEDVTDAQMAKLAEPIRAAIDQLGQEAVALGLVSAESFERNRGVYLHRVYQKYEAEQHGLARMVNSIMGSQRKKIIGDQFRGRGLFQEVALGRLMRDVPDWHEGARGKPQKGEKFLVLDDMPGQKLLALDENETRERPLRRVYWPADREVPDRYSGFVNQGVWEIRGEKGGKLVIWRDFTKEERTKMGEILDARYTIGKTFMLMAHDLSVGKFYQDIAENEAWTRNATPNARWLDAAEWSAQRQRAWKHGDIEWVRVPETEIPNTGGKKRWGALSGRWVREEIWRDLNEIDLMSRPNVWRSLLTQWKLNKTARSPVVHMNNVMSNFVLMDMIDVRWQDFAAGLRSYIAKDEHYEEALRHGAFGADMMTQEIRDNVLRPILEQISRDNTFKQEGRLGALGQMTRFTELLWSKLKALDQKMIDGYWVEDEIFRMATYMRRRELGDDPKQAAEVAREQFIDYDIRAPWVNMARNSVLPFISYTYRAAPLVAKAIATRPWKLTKYFLLAYAANALAYALTGGDEDRERRSLRDQEQGFTWIGAYRMIRMPFNDKHGNPVFLDIRRWMPAGDVFDFNQGQAAIPLIPAWLQIGGPIMLAAEFLLNRQAFTGQPITNEKTDDALDKAGKVADWAYKSWMPSAAYIPGSWYWDKVGNAAKGATDAQGRPYDIGLALSSSVGIKLKPQDVEDGLQWKAYEFRQVEEALKLEERRLGRRKERGLISEAEFNKQMQRVIEKKERVQKKAQETLR